MDLLLERDARRADALEPARHDDRLVLETKLAAEVDRDAREDEVPLVPFTRRAPREPLVAALLEVRRVHGVVHVLVRVDVAPPDLDPLLVHHAGDRTERMRAVPGVRSLLFPRSLAVVGASPRNVEAVETVVRSGVPAWGVNPNRDEVGGLACFPTFADLPETPETALLLVNHERVEQAFEDAAAAGVRAFVVPGVGAEAGSRGSADGRATGRPRTRGRRLHGRPELHGRRRPGRADGVDRPASRDDRSRARVAVLCQSGSIADAFLSLGGRVGFRCIVSSGTEAVTDAADYVSFFAEDDGTRARSACFWRPSAAPRSSSRRSSGARSPGRSSSA